MVLSFSGEKYLRRGWRRQPGDLAVALRTPASHRPRCRLVAVQGRIQREGEVVYLFANHLTDLSADIAGVGERNDGFPRFPLAATLTKPHRWHKHDNVAMANWLQNVRPSLETGLPIILAKLLHASVGSGSRIKMVPATARSSGVV